MAEQRTLISANVIVENLLKDYIQNLENELKADFLVYFGPIVQGVDSEIRDAIELLKTKRKKLVVILETEGGYVEIVERIVNVFRRHYRSVEFIVPNFAMSAGTVLVMSGDAIYMNYFSILGPIDPQVQTQRGGMFIPALGYLDKYKELIDKSRKGELTAAELHFLIEKFDPAMLHKYEQERNLSITLLKKWLARYKFKNWKVTKRREIKVTSKMRKDEAERIGKLLNETERWHTHSRGISMDILRRDLKLEIEDFGKIPNLNRLIKEYYKLLDDYMMKLRVVGLVHTKEQFQPIFLMG
jgi:hypothetical protein